MSYPFFLCLVAAGAQSSERKRVGGAGVLVALQLVSLGNLYWNPRYHREDVREAARFVSSRAAPADLILVFGGIDLPWKHYYQGEARWRMVHPDDKQEWSAERVRNALTRHPVVWTVRGMMWEEPHSEPVIAVVEADAPASERREFPGAVIVTRHQAQSLLAPFPKKLSPDPRPEQEGVDGATPKE